MATPPTLEGVTTDPAQTKTPVPSIHKCVKSTPTPPPPPSPPSQPHDESPRDRCTAPEAA
ncbi:hypothetical protein HK102_012385 [Quaeritorhiza haematococci]|nr:hypothetical protein HK102_012385 [Quaeritorhiza haematococci]